MSKNKPVESALYDQGLYWAKCLSTKQLVRLLGCVGAGEPNVNLRMRLRQVLSYLRVNAQVNQRRISNDPGTRNLPFRCTCTFDGAVGMEEREASFCREGFSCWCQSYFGLGSFEELRTDLLFQLADLPG